MSEFHKKKVFLATVFGRRFEYFGLPSPYLLSAPMPAELYQSVLQLMRVYPDVYPTNVQPILDTSRFQNVKRGERERKPHYQKWCCQVICV